MIQEGTYQQEITGLAASFPDGPWSTEPDKAQWVDAETELDCLIVRTPHGNLCGYVGVPPEHPWYGQDYDLHYDVKVHGGLTYSDRCHGNICHTPLPGRTDDVWWFGFDTAHAWDVVPYWLVLAEEIPDFPSVIMEDAVYRDFAYVTAEITSLAKQIKESA